MFKKLLSSLLGSKEDKLDSSNTVRSSDKKLHIGAISKDIINPSSDEIEKSLTYLSKLNYEDNTFAIFEVPDSGLNFIQINVNEHDITLEYQNLEEEQFSTQLADIQKVIQVFQEYNSGRLSWISSFEWDEVNY